MTTGNPALIELIRTEIKERGPVSFAWFMQQALYHPQHGYYSSGRCAIGRRGDYFTNISVGPLFGQLLAAQFAEIWERLRNSDSRREQGIDNFVIVEQGAHHGDFARDFLESARKGYPEFFAALCYRIIEPFPILQDRQARALAEFEGKIEWRSSIDAVEPFTGVHFSNELLDSMPVHLIVSQCGRGLSAPTECAWLEKFVTLNGDMFAFVDQPIADQTLRDHLEKLPARPAGYQTEVNLAALDWIDNVSRKLKRGYVIAIDYGYSREEFYAPHRSEGTLQIRAQHRRLRSPFDEIGHGDITAHVEWTSIAERGEPCGLQVAGFTDQHRFMTGILSELLRDKLSEEADPKTTRALQTLLHPEMLGRSFQILALKKDIDLPMPLAGFKFGREARSMLGLNRSNLG
jgi:SAM-dependent MidA family methyltransferase